MLTCCLHDELLTVEELMRILKMTRRTVYYLLSSGQLPFALKIKGSWRFKTSDVNAWLEQSKLNYQSHMNSNG